MATVVRGVILVGHGGIPKGCPQELVTKLKRLEAQRRAAKHASLAGRNRAGYQNPPVAEDARRRTPINRDLKRWLLSCEPTWGRCSLPWPTTSSVRPTLEESVEELIKKGATHITVTTTMFTPGGSHSEIEIPEILDHLRPQHPGVELRYAWPFDLNLVADTLAEQIKRFS